MLYVEEDIYCGIFDSSVLRKNAIKSQDRIVSCYEIELFHSEGGTSYVDEGQYPVRRGMILCTKPNQVRHSEFPVRCSFIRIFPAGASRTGIGAILDCLPTCAYIEDEGKTEHLMGLFHQLQGCFAGGVATPAVQAKVNGIFHEILYHCLRVGKRGQERLADLPTNRIARDACEYINENYTGDCSLRHIAEALNISPNHLHTVFVRTMGITPFEYVSQKRIEKAKRLIMAGEKTMLEIALEIGFCSQSHFNKVFKEKTGKTPVEYRNTLWEQY